MANTHPANLGDVLKHLVLCELLSDQPRRYMESHGGRYIYDLNGQDPGQGGIWDLPRAIEGCPALGRTLYARITVMQAGTRARAGTYLGSLGLADRILESSTPIIAAETNQATRSELRRAPWARAPERVHIADVDGQDLVATEARTGDLVLIDPFDVHERSTGGLSSLDAFDAAVGSGATVFLWYPIVLSSDEYSARRHPDSRVPRRGSEPLAYSLHYTQKAAGLWGCGVHLDNVPADTRRRVSALFNALFDGLIEVGDYVGGIGPVDV